MACLGMMQHWMTHVAASQDDGIERAHCCKGQNKVVRCCSKVVQCRGRLRKWNFMSHIQQDRFIHNIKSNWHLLSIRLASCIYGQLQKEMVRRWDLQEKKNIWGNLYTHPHNFGSIEACLALSWVVSGKGGYHHVNNVNNQDHWPSVNIRGLLSVSRWISPQINYLII